jgi:four helix bundle protein
LTQTKPERFLIAATIMPTTAPEDLSRRSFQFASDVYDYGEALVRLRGLPCRIAYQLFDAAGSIGANRSEARSSYSDREFLAKNTICLKEAREAHFWLRLADVKSLGDRRRRTCLLQEANELVANHVTIVRKLKATSA